jgi:hypothetical protein
MNTVLKLTLVCVSLIALGLVFTQPGYTKIELADEDIVGIWLFDEADGDAIVDASGHHADGKINNFAADGVTREEGKFGGALKFPAVDAKRNNVTIPNPQNYNSFDEFTISMWVKATTTGGNQRMFSNESFPGGDGSRNIVWELNGGAGDTARIVFGADGCCKWADAQAPRDLLTDDVWHHIVGLWKQPSLLVYTDGRKGQDKCFDGDSPNGDDPCNALPDLKAAGDPFIIGTRPNDTGNLNGLMDDVALFDRALSEDEIKTIMDDGLAEGALAVSPKGKATTTWGALKSRNTRENFSR